MAQALSIPEKLSEMIQIPTVYGTDQYEIARYRDKLTELFPEVFRRAQAELIGEAMLLKLPGSREELLPVLFTGHMDVVGPVAPGEWRYPPFSGVIEGGKVWGRGALDMKGTQCALLQAVNDRLQGGFAPRRTVYFYLSCDEEVGGATTAQAVKTLKGRGVYLEAVLTRAAASWRITWAGYPANARSCPLRKRDRWNTGSSLNPPAVTRQRPPGLADCPSFPAGGGSGGALA